MNHWERCALILVLTLFLVLATVYNAVSTPFEAPDEIGHFYYVVHLLQTNRLPVVPDSCPACFTAPTERERMKEFLAREERINRHLFASLVNAMRPLMSDSGLERVRDKE